MFNVKSNSGNEINHIFPWNIFKSEAISFFIKKHSSNSMTSKSEFLSFITKVLTQAMEVKLKSNFFHGTYSNLSSFLIGYKIIKCFSDFDNWHLSILLQK